MQHDHAAFSHLSDARRLRRRALFDLLLVALVTVAAAQLPDSLPDRLAAATSALSLGILAFVVRRDRDLRRHAAAGRWREAALEGRGMALSRWRRGEPLAPWEARRDPRVG